MHALRLFAGSASAVVGLDRWMALRYAMMTEPLQCVNSSIELVRIDARLRRLIFGAQASDLSSDSRTRGDFHLNHDQS